MRAFHKKEITKQQIYENIPARRSDMNYRPGMRFETSLITMEKSKAPTTRSQPEKPNQKQQNRY